MVPGRFRLPLGAERWLSVVVIGAVALVVTVRPPYANGPDIRADGLGYHAWTAALLRHDVDFCGDATLVLAKAVPPQPDAAGHCPNKYPPGLALLELPVMAPLSWANNRSLEPGEGENVASRWLGAVALVGTAIALVATSRRLGVAEWATHAAVIAVVFGTGLFHYATYDNSFAHIHLAFLFSLLTYVGVRAATTDREPSALLVFVISFLIVEIREVSVIGLLALAALWVGYRRSTTASAVMWRDRAVQASALGIILAIGVEAMYSTYARGAPSIASYGNEQADPRRAHELFVLFSFNHGLLTWYPVVAVILVGVLTSRRTRTAAAPWVAAIVASTFLYGSWTDSQLGGGFGHRGFLDLMPGAAVLFALYLDAAPRRQRVVALAATAIAVTVAFELMADYWQGSIAFAGTSADAYLNHVVAPGFVLAVVVSGTAALLLSRRRPDPERATSRRQQEAEACI